MIAHETLAPLEYSEGSKKLREAARPEGGIVVFRRKGRRVYASGTVLPRVTPHLAWRPTNNMLTTTKLRLL
jgi:hypothetical protein